MTESIMLINETDDECRIAVVENGILQEMLIEHTASGQTKNNIYKGVVVQVQTSLQAAFVDFGTKKHGFLPNSELNPYLYKDKHLRKNDPIQSKISVGQKVVVQVTREATETKGAALTTNITLPGRFMVLMPNSDKGGVSKKIDDSEERERLKTFLSGIESEEHSVIIRTAGLGRSLTELKKDYTTLKKTWNEIWTKYETMDSTGMILEEPDFVIKSLRDYYTEDIKEVWVDNPETFQKALAFFKQDAPRKQKDLKLFVNDRSLFATYHIERQVEQLTAKQVKLKSGGSIVIDQTEALVAIDVNSGRSNQEGNIDSTALRTNLEAAEEIARQLRLRNLGGLIVIDFIDMENESYRKQVEDKLSKCMEKDKAQLRFNPISQFGLLELSRQRLSVGISSTVETTCPVCDGKGKIPALLASTNLIIRSIRELAAKGNVSRIEGELPLDLVNVLLNDRRQSIYDLEMEFDIDIVLRGRPDIVAFSDRFLKVIYDKRHKSGGAQHKNDQERSDANKKHPQKLDQKKENPQKKHPKGAKHEGRKDKHKQQQKNRPVEPVNEEIVDHDTIEQPVEYQTTEPINPPETVADTDENVGNYGIHPSCLFTDVQELGEDELEEITLSFGNRLKGKIENAPSPLIDNKYLWKSLNGKKNEEKEPSDVDAQSTKEAEVVVEDIGGEKSESTKTTSQHKRSSRRRSHKKKSGPRKEAEAVAEEAVTKESSTTEPKLAEESQQEVKADAESKKTDSKATKKKPSRSRKSTATAKSTVKAKEDEGEAEVDTKKAPQKKSSRSKSARSRAASKAKSVTEEEQAKDKGQKEQKQPEESEKKDSSSDKKATEKTVKASTDEDKTGQKAAPKKKSSRSRAKKKTVSEEKKS